jgi:hypothetical protein
MVLSYWSAPAPAGDLAAGDAAAADHGLRAGQLRDSARGSGLEAYLVGGDLGDLSAELKRGHPVVVGLMKPLRGDRARAHYEVVIGIHREKRLILTLDPAAGLRENSFEGFAREWVPTGRVTLVVFPSTLPRPRRPWRRLSAGPGPRGRCARRTRDSRRRTA